MASLLSLASPLFFPLAIGLEPFSSVNAVFPTHDHLPGPRHHSQRPDGGAAGRCFSLGHLETKEKRAVAGRDRPQGHQTPRPQQTTLPSTRLQTLAPGNDPVAK